MMKKAGSWHGKKDGRMNRIISGSVNSRLKRDGNWDSRKNGPGKMHANPRKVVWEPG